MATIIFIQLYHLGTLEPNQKLLICWDLLKQKSEFRKIKINWHNIDITKDHIGIFGETHRLDRFPLNCIEFLFASIFLEVCNQSFNFSTFPLFYETYTNNNTKAQKIFHCCTGNRSIFMLKVD